MAKVIDTPDGPAEFPDDMPDLEIEEALRMHYQAKPKKSVVVPPIDVDPTKDMSGIEKAGAALVGGVHDVVRGLARKAGASTPHIEEEAALFDKYSKGLGWQGLLGRGGGQAIATPIGGPVKAAGQILVKGVPALAKVAGYGGRVVNPGTVTRGTTEGAISQEVTDDDAQGGAIQGAATPLLAKALGLPGKLLGGLSDMVSPAMGAVKKRAYEAFERELGGREGVTNAVRKITEGGEHALPKSTAAMTGDVGLNALERGARGRRNVDWQSYDDRVGRSAWDELQNVSPVYRTEAGDILREQFNRGGVPQTQKVVGQFDDIEHQVPMLKGLGVRQATGKLANGMSDFEVDHAKRLASELGQYEASKVNTGRSAPNFGAAKDLTGAALAIVSAGTGSTMLWKARSAFNALTGQAMSKTSKEIDEALLDPDKFVKLAQEIQTKTDRNRPLSAVERAFKQAILSSTHTAVPPEKQNAAR